KPLSDWELRTIVKEMARRPLDRSLGHAPPPPSPAKEWATASLMRNSSIVKTRTNTVDANRFDRRFLSPKAAIRRFIPIIRRTRRKGKGQGMEGGAARRLPPSATSGGRGTRGNDCRFSCRVPRGRLPHGGRCRRRCVPVLPPA